MSLLITINDDLVAKVLWYRLCLNSFLEPADPLSEIHIVPKQQNVFPTIRYQVFHLNKQYILTGSLVWKFDDFWESMISLVWLHDDKHN